MCVQEVFEQLNRVVELDLFDDDDALPLDKAAQDQHSQYYRYDRKQFWKGLYYVLQCTDVQMCASRLPEHFR